MGRANPECVDAWIKLLGVAVDPKDIYGDATADVRGPLITKQI